MVTGAWRCAGQGFDTQTGPVRYLLCLCVCVVRVTGCIASLFLCVIFSTFIKYLLTFSVFLIMLFTFITLVFLVVIEFTCQVVFGCSRTRYEATV